MGMCAVRIERCTFKVSALNLSPKRIAVLSIRDVSKGLPHTDPPKYTHGDWCRLSTGMTTDGTDKLSNQANTQAVASRVTAINAVRAAYVPP